MQKPLYPPESAQNDPNQLSALADFNKAISLDPKDEYRVNKIKTLLYLWRFKECVDEWIMLTDEKYKKKAAKYAVAAYEILGYETIDKRHYAHAIAIREKYSE